MNARGPEVDTREACDDCVDAKSIDARKKSFGNGISMDETNHRNPWRDSDVESHWDAVAGIYVRENARVRETHDQRFIKSVEYLELLDNEVILNVSSRDGEAAEFITRANQTVRVVNAEISAGLMRVAAALRPWIEQVKIDSYSSLPFPSGSFDKTLSLETLEHAPDPLQFLSEIHRVTKRGGTLVLSCPPATSELPYRIYTLLFGGHGEGPHRFLSTREVKWMLGKTRWRLRRHTGTLLIPVGPKILRSLGETIIASLQDTPVSELGIRQFYVCTSD